jgi:Domain of unknown function (DUF4386)
MSESATGVLLLVTPIWFNVWFLVLARRFDYPDIIRRPVPEILERFRAGGASLILTWWAFMLSGLALVAVAALVGVALAADAWTLAIAGIVVGALAGLVQVLGLLRWVYLVPSLSRMYGREDSSQASREAIEVTFMAFHQYLGVGVGEHLGYLLTGLWTFLVGAAAIQGDVVPAWLGWIAIPIGALLAIGSVEFLGPNEEHGWRLAGTAIPVLYVAWSAWLLAMGIAFLIA